MTAESERRNEEDIKELSTQLNDLHRLVTKLSTEVKLGFERTDESFKGVHTRQDKTNGRIDKGENERAALQQEIHTLKDVDTETLYKVNDLRESKKKREDGQSKMSERWMNILFQVIAAAIMVGIGLILLNADKILELW